MSCGCHKKNGEEIKGIVKPDDQCLQCTAKHLEMAITAWGEFQYEESNRRWVAGHLRLAVEHSKIEWRDLAMAIRDIAVKIELAQDTNRQDIKDRLLDIFDLILKRIKEDNPDIKKRLDSLNDDRRIDILIPLGNGTFDNNNELKILLRSIDKHVKDLGRIYLITTGVPKFVNTDVVQVVPIEDTYEHNKDANLHKKVLETIRKFGIKDFVFCADDNAFLQDVRLASLPKLHNSRGIDRFPADGSIWQQRMRHTFEWSKERGVELPYNFECHAPQRFDGQRLIEKMNGVDYESLPGLTIYTTWRVVLDDWQGSQHQNTYKWTFDNAVDETPRTIDDAHLCSKMFVGYSDAGVQAGITTRLLKHFSEPCRFEKEDL